MIPGWKVVSRVVLNENADNMTTGDLMEARTLKLDLELKSASLA